MRKLTLANRCATVLCVLSLSFFASASMMAATVKGRVWQDANTNGIQDAGETGMGGVWVELDLANGMMVTGMLSNPDGSYQFDNVAAGTYKVKFANPGGIFQTIKDAGSNDAVDNDADQLGYTDVFTLAASDTKTLDGGFTFSATGCFTPITITVTNVKCDDHGTPCDPSDDTFTFDLSATTAGGGTWGWDIPSLGIFMHPWGTPRTFGPYPSPAGPVTISLFDHDIPDCKASVTVAPPACAPPPAVLTLTCPTPFVAWTDPGKDVWTVALPAPTASSTCPLGTVTVVQTGGPLPGAQVPAGMYTITYKATDGCCNEKTCSYKITVKDPCDEKMLGGIIFDLLEVTSNATHHKTYCIRVTNTTAAPLQYVAFQLPNGVVAEAPANGSVYTAPSGRTYDVRNPNFSPFYSIRFKTINGATGIKSGESDIFKYTLQPQVNPWYIHAIARTAPKTFNEVYLTTADCMPTLTPNGPNSTVSDLEATSDEVVAADRTESPLTAGLLGAFKIYPNPANDYLLADVSKWENADIHLQLIDAQGRILRSIHAVASDEPAMLTTANIPDGIYFLRAMPADGLPEVRRVVVRH